MQGALFEASFKQSYEHPSELQKELCKQLYTAILIWSHDIEELYGGASKGVRQEALHNECEKELDQEHPFTVAPRTLNHGSTKPAQIMDVPRSTTRENNKTLSAGFCQMGLVLMVVARVLLCSFP